MRRWPWGVACGPAEAEQARQAAQAMGKSLNQAVRDDLEQLAGCVQPVHDALDLHALHQVSIWDALIVQVARQSGCIQVLTEDLQAGTVIGGVRIVNPFAAVRAWRGPKRR